jgi:alpha-L-arabinofuranosidase
VELLGSPKLAPKATAIVLTSANPKDENTLDEPNKVVPKTETITLTGSPWTHAFPGNSLTVLRLPAAN